MWNRQNPAYLIAQAIKLLSAGTAAVGTIFGIYLLAAGSGAAAANVCFGLTAAVLTAAAIIIWRCDLWRLGRSLGRQYGLFSINQYGLHRDALTALEIKRSPFLAVFGSVKVSLFTSADREKQAERSALTVKREDGRRLAGRLMPMGNGYVRQYSARRSELFLLALSQADFLSGLLLTVPFISWTAKNIDRRLSERLYSALENTGQMILPNVSPIISAAALIPAAGWLAHMIYTFFSCGRFRFVRSGESIMTGRGIIVRRTVCFPLSAVTALETRRTLLTGVFGRESSRVVIPGYGSCLLLPPTDRRSSAIETASIFPHGEPGMRIDTAELIRWWRWWFLGGAAFLVVTVRTAITAGVWRDAILLCGILVVFIFLWRAAIGAAAGKTAGVRMFADSVEITGVRGLSIYRMRVLRGCISKISVTQNLFQQISGLCTLHILPHGAKHGLRCCHLPLERCLSLIGRLG